ncbi:MAG: 1-acyl-sn-glycerol-3-phosphate acyltransferase [Bacteroidales bacterium]
MIQANHTSWFQNLFDIYLRYSFKRHFHTIQIEGNIRDKGLPMLLIANHISWWDGFWLLHTNKKKFHRKFHVMMLEEQLKKNRFLSRLGAFSIKRKTRSALDSIHYARQILTSTSNLLLLFPQGEIQSQYKFPFVFEQGWQKILKDIHHPIQIVMVCNVIDYFSHQKPTLFQYLYSPDQNTELTCATIEKMYNNFYQQSISQQADRNSVL